MTLQMSAVEYNRTQIIKSHQLQSYNHDHFCKLETPDKQPNLKLVETGQILSSHHSAANIYICFCIRSFFKH